ncbi:MAG: CDP-diacylglycerol--glycerol-3-phosphate 3-phosphatidyltransferase [Clostridiales bacterium]|nr:CDP-diacylglycerol--glycerol-3-phosphate 3-phosphatidyltransferase [Clostridiales bacterium]
MNLPNKLSILRIALIPFILLTLYVDTAASNTMALLLFVAASFTDWLDGYLARKNDIVTNFGKFLDPIADKLLVLSTMIGLCGMGYIPAWACVVVLFRELSVDGLRLVAVEQRRVIAASKLGKLKTVTQMFMLIAFLLQNIGLMNQPIIPQILMWAAVFMTLLSGVDYFIKNKDVLKLGGM